MCCSSGVCGPDVDPLLPSFAGMLAQLAGKGVEVKRFNLAQQPLAFAENPTVRNLMEKNGVEVLPIIFLEDEIVLQGHYPDAQERAALYRRIMSISNPETSSPE